MRSFYGLFLLFAVSVIACREKASPEKQCPFTVGPLRTDRMGWENKILEEGRNYGDTLWVWNPDDIVHVLQIRVVRDGIRCEGGPLTVGAGECRPLPVEIQAGGECMEYRVVPFYPQVDGEFQTDVPFYMKAHIVQDFREIREKGDELPLPDKGMEEYDFGIVPADTVVQKIFCLVNTGRANLSVGKTEIFCPCTQVHLSATEIAPADTLWVNVSLHTGSHEGVQKRSVSLYCNSPEIPVVKYWIRATIDKTKRK